MSAENTNLLFCISSVIPVTRFGGKLAQTECQFKSNHRKKRADDELDTRANYKFDTDCNPQVKITTLDVAHT